MVDSPGCVARDLRLWAEAAGGDADAKAALAGMVGEVARANARRLRLPAPEVEEIESRMQTSIWCLMATASSTPRVSLRAWLRFRFLAVVKQYFRETKRVRAIAPLLEDAAEAGGPPVGFDAEGTELRDALMRCLDALPGPQRDAVLRRYQFEGIAGPEDAAADGGTNPNTLRVWVFRGITALRDCLRSRGVA